MPIELNWEPKVFIIDKDFDLAEELRTKRALTKRLLCDVIREYFATSQDDEEREAQWIYYSRYIDDMSTISHVASLYGYLLNQVSDVTCTLSADEMLPIERVKYKMKNYIEVMENSFMSAKCEEWLHKCGISSTF